MREKEEREMTKLGAFPTHERSSSLSLDFTCDETIIMKMAWDGVGNPFYNACSCHLGECTPSRTHRCRGLDTRHDPLSSPDVATSPNIGRISGLPHGRSMAHPQAASSSCSSLPRPYRVSEPSHSPESSPWPLLQSFSSSRSPCSSSPEQLSMMLALAASVKY